MLRCRTLLCTLLLAIVMPPAWAAEDDDPFTPRQIDGVENRWGVGLAYGTQRYGSEGNSGTSAAVQLIYRAFVDIRAPWLFELGFERSLSRDDPEIEPGRERRIQSTGLFYRFSRILGGRTYLGGRVGLARIRGAGEEDSETLDYVVGLQLGARATSWLDVGIEALAGDPDTGEGAAYPAELRGVVTISF